MWSSDSAFGQIQQFVPNMISLQSKHNFENITKLANVVANIKLKNDAFTFESDLVVSKYAWDSLVLPNQLSI